MVFVTANFDLLFVIFSTPLLMAGFFRTRLFVASSIAQIAMEHLRDAVIIVDEKDRVFSINRAAKKWFNLSDRFVGESVFKVLPKPDAFKEKWQTANARVKFKFENESGRAWYDSSITHLYKRDGAPLGRVIVFHDITQEQELLEAEFRHSMQLGLLQEVSRQTASEITEVKILQRSVEVVVNYFGYAEAAISLLTKDNMLEVVAISGTQDYGYQPSFKQQMGKGVIGHVAETRSVYIAEDVSTDPYYFSNEAHEGSAIGIPLIMEDELLGVLYIESAQPGAFSKEDAQTLEMLAAQVVSSMQRARLYAELHENLRIMSAVQSISQTMSSTLEIETICQSVVKVLSDLFGYSHISIYLLEGDYLHLGGQIGYHDDVIFKKIHSQEGISGRALKTLQTQFVPDVSDDPEFLRASPDVKSEICVPLLKEKQALGILNIEAMEKGILSDKDVQILNMLAGPMALAVDNARLHMQVKIAAMTDAVTGIYNRRAFEEMLRREMERAARARNHISLIIFDLDSFKQYNDMWGHPAGDERLKATARLIRKNLRKYDIAARYGGDEFAVILPDTTHDGGMEFAKRLLAAARSSVPEPLANGGSVSGYTLSMGVATFPEHGKTFTELLLAADHAELESKRRGKNQITSADELKSK